MSKGLIWLCFVAGGLVVADPAAAKVIRCDVCTADVDFRREAELAGAGTHLVYNLHDNVLQQWYVPGGSGVETALIVVPVAQLGLNPSVVDKTAYDFVLDYNMRAMVESAAGSTNVISSATGTDVMSEMADPTSVGTGHIGLQEQARPPFKIVFKDGSSVVIRVDRDHANGRYESGSARTAAGQLIPADVQQAVGVWTDYGGDDLERMADQLRRLGKTVTMAASAHGVIRMINCTSDGCIAQTASN